MSCHDTCAICSCRHLHDSNHLLTTFPEVVTPLELPEPCWVNLERYCSISLSSLSTTSTPDDLFFALFDFFPAFCCSKSTPACGFLFLGNDLDLLSDFISSDPATLPFWVITKGKRQFFSYKTKEDPSTAWVIHHKGKRKGLKPLVWPPEVKALFVWYFNREYIHFFHWTRIICSFWPLKLI